VMEALLLVAEQDGPPMFARIGVMRAIEPRLRSGVLIHRVRIRIGEGASWRRIGEPLRHVHRRQWFGRSRHEMRVPSHCRREHHKCAIIIIARPRMP
jgi:hypothetical protein